MKPKPMCRNCGVSKASRPRGLCWKCYYTPGVKEKFKRHPSDPNAELTDAELEVMIAEQLRDRPKWWDRESAAADREMGHCESKPRWIWKR